MNILKSDFGIDKYGNKIYEFKIENNKGNYISVLNYGATLKDVVIHDKNNEKIDVSLGYKTISEYETNDAYVGAIVGRHANRIKDGKFELNGKVYNLAKNNNENHIHGGEKGFDKYIWDVEIHNNKLIFTRKSKDLEEGYPGNLKIKVVYEFNDDNELTINYEAVSDKDTVVNLTNHAYFNLNGENDKDILNHILKLNCSTFTENDDKGLPTGKILSVDKTPFDFRNEKEVGRDIDSDDIQIKNGLGYDHNFIIDGDEELKYVGYLLGNKSNIRMDMYTTCPGVQLYTSNALTKHMGKSGNEYKKRCALCLEAQYYPNSLEHKHFPSVVLKANDTYKEKTIYKFSI